LLLLQLAISCSTKNGLFAKKYGAKNANQKMASNHQLKQVKVSRFVPLRITLSLAVGIHMVSMYCALEVTIYENDN
jgi:hypothetical protein